MTDAQRTAEERITHWDDPAAALREFACLPSVPMGLTPLMVQAARTIEDLTAELDEAKQLAVRQANEIRKLKLKRETREVAYDVATEESWKYKQGDDYGSY